MPIYVSEYLKVSRDPGFGDTRGQKYFVRMNRKFGGGRQPTGTPSLAWSCVVVVFSLLAGASVVHNIYKPNLVSF